MSANLARPGWTPDGMDRALAAGAVLMLGAATLALVRGAPQLARLPLEIQLHLGTVIVGLALTPVLLLRRRGTPSHRWLGYGWVIAMGLAAASSLLVQTIRPGHYSPIHLLSLYVLVQLPLLVRAARRHDVARHRAAISAPTTICRDRAGRARGQARSSAKAAGHDLGQLDAEAIADRNDLAARDQPFVDQHIDWLIDPPVERVHGADL